MNQGQDWSGWGEDWQQQSVVDVDRLRRAVRRKRWQMRLVVMAEVLLALFAGSQVLRLLLVPELGWRWTLWAGLALVMIAEMTWLSFRARRGTWRSATSSIPDLLRLTAKQARAGIRLAWLNAVGFAVLVIITLSIAAPWLAPSRWLHDPSLQRLLLLQIGLNGMVALGFVGFLLFYISRKKRQVRKLEALLREHSEKRE